MRQKRRPDIDSMVPLREGEEGFGLVEAAIVLAIISIFTGVGIPAFNCVRRRAISQAAQVTIQQIKDECESNYVYGIDEFTATSPSQYQIKSSRNNSCSAGKISLVPSDTKKYPTYYYKFNESELSYNFKGQTGTSFVACNKLICGEDKYSQDFVVKDSLSKRGCSEYLAVKAQTWEEAEANARKLGGHLIAINDKGENDHLISTYIDKQNRNFFIGATDSEDYGASEGNWMWTNGQPVDMEVANWYPGEPNNYAGSSRFPEGEDFSVISGAPQDGDRKGYWNDTVGVDPEHGIVEVPSTCDSGSSEIISESE